MRFFRFITIAVLLLSCVVLGTACTGAQGEQGPQGETGATGATGLQGPQGIQGLQGLQGIQGIQGEKGDTGLPGIGVEWVGEWDSSVLYAKYDAVGYQGSSYISKQNNNTNNLPTDTNWWDSWVEKGDTGANGADGADGAPGLPGAPGADGQDGAPGPNMIVAMGMVYDSGTGPSVVQDYNVGTCIYDSSNSRYDITLTGITYVQNNYVTLVTATGNYHAGYAESAGHLTVYVANYLGADVHGSFSFMVLQVS